MLKNLSARMVTITCLGFLFLSFAAYALTLFSQIQSMTDARNEEKASQSGLLHVANARYHIVNIQQFITDAAATGNEEGFLVAREILDDARKELSLLVNLHPDLKQSIESLPQQLEQLIQVGADMVMAYAKQGREAGNIIMQKPINGFDALVESINGEIGKLSAELNADAEKATAFREQHEHITFIVITTATMILLALTALLGGTILFKTITPLGKLVAQMEEIDQGDRDLTVRLPADGNDEIARAERAFNGFAETIQGTLREIYAMALTMNQVNQDMGIVYENTMNGMRQLEDETAQVATAMNEMSATVQNVAKSATDAAAAANNANFATAEGREIVNKNVDSIQELAEQIKKATSVITTLNDSADRIESILSLIREISDQTNLLSLNAAIEAARAGEAGRGFAVVASEVRSLAGKTQDATNEIQDMIEQLQVDAKSAVSAMEQGRQQADQTIEYIGDMEQALHKIAQSVQSIDEMNTQIATAAEEQSLVAEEINRNISAVTLVAQNTMSDARKTGALRGHIGLLASNNLKTIKQFNLGQMNHSVDLNVLVQWDTEKYGVDVAEIDKQHQRLFDLINQLYSALMQNKGRDAIGNVVDGLVDYAQTHLKDEEQLMLQAEYPDFDNHKKIHDKIMGQARDLQRRFQSGETAMAHELMDFLRNWLVDHIQSVDRKYVPSLHAKGIR